jgi:hypothetical protein
MAEVTVVQAQNGTFRGLQLVDGGHDDIDRKSYYRQKKQIRKKTKSLH